MAARASMAALISLLRIKVNDTGSAIWTDDDELQTYLDMHRRHIMREQLIEDVDQKIFLSQSGMFEGDTSTWDDDATIIAMWDSDGADATAVTPDSYNLVDGAFYFTSDQDNTYYLDALSYDLNSAIAECLEQLATDSSKARAWERGGVRYEYSDYMDMAAYHRQRSGLDSLETVRTYRK